MKPNKDSGNKFIRAIEQNIDVIAIWIFSMSLFISLLVLASDYCKNRPKKEVVPHIRIDYINPDGTIRYSRYSNDVNYGRGSVYYVDFETGAIVNTTETVNITRIN